MIRIISPLFVLVLVGCAAEVGTADVELHDLRGREALIHVRVSGLRGNWGGIAVVADVRAEGPTWAALERPHLFSGSGVTQRFDGGSVELDLERQYLDVRDCAGGICERDYRVRLDSEPALPWSVILSVTIDAEGASSARVEIELVP